MQKKYSVKASKDSKARKDIKAAKAWNVEDYEEDEDIMQALRSASGYDEDDDSHDDDVLDDFRDSRNDIFDAVCDHNGLYGFGEDIRDWVASVYDVTLDDYD